MKRHGRRRAAWWAGALLLLWLALPLPAARGQQPPGPAAITVSADRTTVTVGDRIQVAVTVTLPADARLDTAALEAQFVDQDVLFVGLPVERLLPDGRKEIQIAYVVAAYRTGQTQLPPLEAAVTLVDGSRALATAPAVPVLVESVIPAGENPTEVRDLKPPVGIAAPRVFPTRAVAAGVGGTLVVLLLLALLVRRLRRRAPARAPLMLPLTAEALARQELERIASLELVEQRAYAELHALLAACIRRYLTDRYHFPAYALTTAELRRRMADYGVDRWQGRLVVGLLTEADNVCFAGYTPAGTRAEANLEMAFQIVEAGEPREQPAPVAVGAG